MSTYHDLPPLAKNYLNYMLTIKGRSVRTADGYAIDLRTFFRFIKLHRNLVPPDTELSKIEITDIQEDLICSITLSDVYEFLTYTMHERSNSAKTRSRKVSSLRGFFKYLTVNTQILNENPIKNLEMPSSKKSMPVYLTVEQSMQLLDQSAKSNTKTQYRDYCILTLFLNCGMRLSELVGINLFDFNLESSKLKLLGKGNKERMIYINDACKSAIDNYLTKERKNISGIKDKQALFLSSRSGKRLGARYVQLVVSNALKNAGLDHMGFSTHKLRHTAATLMYQEGNVDILVLKELLGHQNVGTTEIYTHVSDAKVKDAVNSNPLSKLKKKD